MDGGNAVEEKESRDSSVVNFTDRAVMVGKTIISQLKVACTNVSEQIGQLEINPDVGYSSESSAYISNDSAEVGYSYSPSLMVDNDCSMDDCDMTLRANKLAHSKSSEFYTMTLVVPEEIEDGGTLLNGKMIDSGIGPNALSEEEGLPQLNSTPKRSSEKPNTSRLGVQGHTDEKIKQWLTNQGSCRQEGKIWPPITVYSSCDASGEYTSNDDAKSDSSEEFFSMCEQSSGPMEFNSDKQQNNVSDAQNSEPATPVKIEVVMRKKKRSHVRPWSVTELYQMSSRLDLSPFSISETALNNLNVTASSFK